MADGLKVERHGRVLVVTIDRQERMNALSQEVYDGLLETWTSLQDAIRSVRAIVITGAGERAFCTGMDLKAFAERGGPRPVKDDVHEELRLTPLHCDVWLPTIVAVNGVCTGAGLHFVADADVVVASSTASFLDTHVSVGPGRRRSSRSRCCRASGSATRCGSRCSAGTAASTPTRRCGSPRRRGRRARRACSTARWSWPSRPRRGSPAAIEASKRAIRGALERPMARGDAARLGAAARAPGAPRQQRRPDGVRREAGAEVAVTEPTTVDADADAIARGRALPPRRSCRPTGSPRSTATTSRRSARVRREVDPDEIWARDRRRRATSSPTWPRSTAGSASRRKVGAAIARALGRYKMPRFNNPVGVDLVGPGDPALGDRRAEGSASCRPIAALRGHLVPAVLRAGRRLRPRGPGARGRSATATRGSCAGQKVWTSLGDIAALRHPAGAHRPRRAEAPGHHRVPGADGAPRASRCGRCARSPATPSSARSSSTTRASTTRCGSARSTRAGGSPSRC